MIPDLLAGGRVRVAALATLLVVLAPAAGVTGLAGPAAAQAPAAPSPRSPAASTDAPGWKIGIVNTADARGEILPCT